MIPHHTENIADTSAAATMIPVAGLEKPLTVLHVTDSHLSVLDQAEAQYHRYSSRMDNAYRDHDPVAHFVELMKMAMDRHVDLIVLTGDIVNNPSKSSVAFIRRTVQATGIRSLYVAGNHDWHYEGMEGAPDVLRETWMRESLAPLYDGANLLCYAVQLGGVNFVAIDNSTYQVNEEQLAFYEQEVARGLPMVLLAHIPLYVTARGNSVSACGDPRWGWETDKNYVIERRRRWPKSGNLSSTVAFVDRVKRTENLVAVLAGHIHVPSEERLSESAMQYVTAAAYDGSYRLVALQP